MSGFRQRFMAKYSATPNSTPGAQRASTAGSNRTGIPLQCSPAPIVDIAARHTAAPIPATNPPATG